MDLWSILADIVILLSASLVLGGLCSRFGQSPLIGYLVAGMLLGGPGSIHAVRSQREIEAIAELGVALLLFSLGLEFSVQRLRKLGARPLWGGVIQVVVTTLLGAGGALLCGTTGAGAIAFGVMISLSSTAVVLRMLMERSELEMPHGRNSLAVLLTQDMAVVPLAVVMTLLGGGGGLSGTLLQAGTLLLMSAVVVAGLFLLNKAAVRALGTLILHPNRELTVILAVAIGLGSAWAAHAAGISPALGAFIAGMFLGSSAFATQIRADISSLRVVLLTLFFGAAGMVADPIWILKNAHIVAAVTALLTIGKLAVIWGIFQMLGHSLRVAAATGLCLAQIGEFAFVLGSVGRNNGVVTEEMYALVVSVTIVSFFLSAFLVPLAPRFGFQVAALFGGDSASADHSTASEPAPDAVIIGFGPAGQIAGHTFLDRGLHVTVIDLNRQGVQEAERLGFHGLVGDATQYDVLEHVKLNESRLVVITVPHHLSALTILQHVRRCAPQAHVVLRSRYQRHTDEFVQAGALVVVGDEEEVGARLSERVREWLDSLDGTQSEPADDAV